MRERRAAFFDIDDTLIKGSTGGYLIRHLYNQRHIRLGSVLRLLYYVALYRLNRMRQVEVYRWGYGLCGNRSLTQVREILDGAFERYVRRRVYREGLALLDERRDRDETAKRLLSNKRVGVILREMGVIDDRDLREMVRKQLGEIVFSTCGWESGDYCFVAGSLPTIEEITLKVSVESLISVLL